MNETTKKKLSIVWSSLGVKAVLGLFLVAAFTVLMAGAVGMHLGSWREGQIAPHTVYAPFRFSIQDQERSALVERGELLISKGERLTPLHVLRLSALDQAQSAGRTRSQWLGAFLLAWLFSGVGAVYLKRYEPKVWRAPSQQVLIIAVVGIVLGLSQLILQSPLDSFALVPVAGVSMLLGMLLGPQLGILIGLLTTGLLALIGRADLPFVIGLSAGCFTGVYAVQGIRRRIDFFRAGLVVGFAQWLAIVSSSLLLQRPLDIALGYGLSGFLGAIFSTMVTFCLLPICESLFGLITDVSLLELSDLNHPLLKELSVKAPGTYHHSLIVANLAEAACAAIGANALLARVGCYFHDIGKMLHPEYFVENQPPKVSRHDRLLPSMSSLVILNHVKEGIDLARKARLNQAVIDFIPGHHGTGLIYYFYRRAIEEVEDQNQLQEERFRYPGPKPYTRETAIALLADSSEAATRALSQKTPARIEEVVRRIINNKFIDGQLDECKLTLRDLHRIAEAFLRVLTGIYHSRIEYPKAPGEELEDRSSATG